MLFVLPALFVLLAFLSFVHKESVHWKSQLKQGEIKREASERDSHYTRLETALGINSLESTHIKIKQIFYILHLARFGVVSMEMCATCSTESLSQVPWSLCPPMALSLVPRTDHSVKSGVGMPSSSMASLYVLFCGLMKLHLRTVSTRFVRTEDSKRPQIQVGRDSTVISFQEEAGLCPSSHSTTSKVLGSTGQQQER